MNKTSKAPTPVPPSRRWKRFAFNAVAVVLPLVLLESASRVVWFASHKADMTQQRIDELANERRFESDDEVPYAFPSHDEFFVNTTPTRTNNIALRGDYDIDGTESYAGLRIVCLGDSVTFGYCVSGNGACYPAILEQRLRNAGIECQVINMGMPRYRAQHMKLMWSDYVYGNFVDVLIFLGGWNNINDQILSAPPAPTYISFFDRNCYSFKLARQWRGTTTPVSSRLSGVVNDDGYRQYLDSVDAILDEARAYNVQPVICTLPHYLDELLADETLPAPEFLPPGTVEQIIAAVDRMNHDLKEAGNQYNVPVIDLVATINSSDLFADAIHPNDEGTRRMADKIADYLLEHRDQLLQKKQRPPGT